MLSSFLILSVRSFDKEKDVKALKKTLLSELKAAKKEFSSYSKEQQNLKLEQREIANMERVFSLD
jgi:hypothetical protein